MQTAGENLFSQSEEIYSQPGQRLRCDTWHLQSTTPYLPASSAGREVPMSSSEEKASGLLLEFDPLSSPDQSLSTGQQASSSDGQFGHSEDSTVEAGRGAALATTTLPSGEKTATYPQSSETPATPVESPASLTTPPHSSEFHAQSPPSSALPSIQDVTIPPQSLAGGMSPQSSVVTTQSAEDSAVPTPKASALQPSPTTTDSIAKATPITNEERNSTLEALPIQPQSADSAISPDASSSAKKKKKKRKKHKQHASSEMPSNSHMTEPADTRSAQIGSQISEIDQFLQSLKMGTYDAILPQETSQPPAPPVVAATSTVVIGSKVVTGSNVTVAGSNVPTGGSNVTTVGSKVTTAAQASLGLQLIGGFESSSSSSDSSESSSESSEEEEVAMVVIE